LAGGTELFRRPAVQAGPPASPGPAGGLDRATYPKGLRDLTPD
jgi:hypothetical protein